MDILISVKTHFIADLSRYIWPHFTACRLHIEGDCCMVKHSLCYNSCCSHQDGSAVRCHDLIHTLRFSWSNLNVHWNVLCLTLSSHCQHRFHSHRQLWNCVYSFEILCLGCFLCRSSATPQVLQRFPRVDSKNPQLPVSTPLSYKFHNKLPFCQQRSSLIKCTMCIYHPSIHFLKLFYSGLWKVSKATGTRQRTTKNGAATHHRAQSHTIHSCMYTYRQFGNSS